MPPKNKELEKTIIDFVKKNPGLHRSGIAKRLRLAGLDLGTQHLINRVTMLISNGVFVESLDPLGLKTVTLKTRYMREKESKNPDWKAKP